VGAKAGTLAIMVGGPRDTFDSILPIFQAMGKTITYVGESGAGQVAKACNQIMVAAQMVAMGELILLAQKSGVDPRRVIDAIQGGAAQCWALDVKPQRLFAGERQPGFKAYMQHKDLGIVLDTARAYGMPLPATVVVMQLFEAMLQMGMEDLDNSGVIGVLEVMANERLILEAENQ
ncbi:MAG: NAD(P)-dependent oxidoreductase, partial [Anaerolineales bacterium]